MVTDSILPLLYISLSKQSLSFSTTNFLKAPSTHCNFYCTRPWFLSMYHRSREDLPQDPYNQRPLPDDSHRLYPQSHLIPRDNIYASGSHSVDDLDGHYAHRRYASGGSTGRYHDQLDYSMPHLPPMSPGMARIDTQFTHRDPPLATSQPLSATSVDISGESESWSPTLPAKPRKTRREKPRIELAPDQPPTTQGKPRARVYVACVQCRTRKIRCDGAKPVCHNCGKRSSGSSECNYDPLPKRRGPDKTPGARQRVARKSTDGGGTRGRRRTSSADAQDYVPGQSSNQSQQSFAFPSPSSSEQSPEEYVVSPHEARIDPPFLSPCPCHGLTHCPSSGTGVLGQTLPGPQITVPLGTNSLNILLSSPIDAPVSRSFISEYETNDDDPGIHINSTITTTIVGQPTLDFSRKTWWDNLLVLYQSPTSMRLESLTSAQRIIAIRRISSDIRFLFHCSSYWFSFVHIPTFFTNFYDPVKRDMLQPSLILSALALGVFFRSSEIELGQRGRERALMFREEAQSALEASLNAGWVDDTLAQAAWLLALFEVCANPNHTSERSSSAMVTLDSIIRSLSLTLVDLDEPSTSTFSPGKVPAVADALMGAHQHHRPYSSGLPVSNDHGCVCASLTLKEQWPKALEHTPLWAQTPAWDPSWSEAEIRKESIRRLCWSSIVLAAGHSSYSSATRSHTVSLFIADPSNYALLFSGEAMVHSPNVVHTPSPKDTIWALYDRAFLLWHACIKIRNDTAAPVADKGHFAIKAWLEADAIEEALNRHTCGIERAFVYLGREYIFKCVVTIFGSCSISLTASFSTRMCITYEFQRFVPLVSANVSGLFHRPKAEEWLGHQAIVAQQFMNGMHTITGNSNNHLSRRPFFIFWFMGQVSRCLSLWQCDKSMSIALEVGKSLLAPIDYLASLWPCAEQRYRYDSLRERLREACQLAGIPLPPPINLTVPSSTIIEEYV
ncbi:Zn(2)-C6 fungal-type domain-containing protein [Favolaschia claudopus]|uniref:Zn(2)-C6 fungal-type domain-containing protein n=1 Tax=Favolaschia claudopus TaxID=2862362 RepID=A0AAW0DAN6_9AGAR